MSGVAINILFSDILFFIAGPCAIYIFTNNSRSKLLRPLVFYIRFICFFTSSQTAQHLSRTVLARIAVGRCVAGLLSGLSALSLFSPSQEPGKTPEKCPYCVTGAQKGVKMRTGLTKRQKTTEIFFDETKSRITVYTHNTDLKKRLTAYAERYPDHCTMTDEDSETGYKAFEIEKGRLSFRLTAPYSEERRRAASDYAKKVTNFMQQGD